MQVRVNGKVGTLEDARSMLETKVSDDQQRYNLKKWYRRTIERLELGEERIIVNRFGHPEIVIDNFIGTETEYQIHRALIKLEKYGGRIDSQEYADQEEVVNYLLKEWRRES